MAELRSQREGGYILVTGMLFLLVITMVAVNSMGGATMDYRISANMAFEANAFEASEAGRRQLVASLENYIEEGDWSGKDASMSITDHGTEKNGTNLAMANTETSSSIDFTDLTSIDKDATYTVSAQSGKPGSAIDANGWVVRLQDNARLAPGSTNVYWTHYAIVSQATSTGGATVTTASEMRSQIVTDPQNQ
ncbi:pilus assembly PilX family protein [Marinobacterium jannaschii]|uniref:pilus assembly PilX family protein n=1 Tax=Marinobacterium jannaschii TaxID=64970 RepID=UPI0004836E8B|nr:PilX N-terminal domain-containing pilus assembly protein [Marinobacterium jannaschii]